MGRAGFKIYFQECICFWKLAKNTHLVICNIKIRLCVLRSAVPRKAQSISWLRTPSPAVRVTPTRRPYRVPSHASPAASYASGPRPSRPASTPPASTPPRTSSLGYGDAKADGKDVPLNICVKHGCSTQKLFQRKCLLGRLRVGTSSRSVRYGSLARCDRFLILPWMELRNVVVVEESVHLGHL